MACGPSGNEIPFSEVSGAGVGADIDCLFSGREPSSPVVIRSENDFDQWNQCFSGLSSFDFTQRTLIAALMNVEGCDFGDSRLKKVTKDEQSKIVTVHFQIKGVGDCAGLYRVITLISVDPLPSDYAVVSRTD
jgi:hypothetical protein